VKGVRSTSISSPDCHISVSALSMTTRPIYKGEIRMKMRDIIQRDSYRFFKKEYLERPYELEKKRREIYKELRSLGTPSYKAFQLSQQRMKI